eukprot:UC1_evm4s337
MRHITPPMVKVMVVAPILIIICFLANHSSGKAVANDDTATATADNTVAAIIDWTFPRPAGATNLLCDRHQNGVVVGGGCNNNNAAVEEEEGEGEETKAETKDDAAATAAAATTITTTLSFSSHSPSTAPLTTTLLAPKVFEPLRLGTLAPGGWLHAQLVVQAGSLSGAMASSTFPGAVDVNMSSWVGGNGSHAGGTDQWLPYWTNGNVPLVILLEASAASATDQAIKSKSSTISTAFPDPWYLTATIDRYMAYVLAHTNKTSGGGPGFGWIGPFMNEPGDNNGHGLWDPLNMLRSLIAYAQGRPHLESQIAAATVAHLTAESKLLVSDPVYKWAQTRWPTFVELCQYVIDTWVPKYGSDSHVMPLGASATTRVLINASALFQAKGMNWYAYYHRTGAIKFPKGSVEGWNTNDHGVNNAEGAMRWPAVAWRMNNTRAAAEQMDVVLHMMDTYQGQVQSLFCADEVFCGRDPHRGTETCAVVEAMASLELSFMTFGTPALWDRVERLAFNAMPAAYTADMWTHVYVQQANSVFAGHTGPAKGSSARDPSLRSHKLDARSHAHGGSPVAAAALDQQQQLGDTPSGEDQSANFYGVSHFPCCITNGPQGWPKFAQHTVQADVRKNAVVVASLIAASATMPLSVGGGARVSINSRYPFGDNATVTVTAAKPTTARIRIPVWATRATVNNKPAANGTFVDVACAGGGANTTISVALNPEVRIERGWGTNGVRAGTPVNYDARGADIPTLSDDLVLSGGAALTGSRAGQGLQDIRSGSPNQNTSVVVAHPIAGAGHYVEEIDLAFRYVAGYEAPKGQGSIIHVDLVDAAAAANTGTAPAVATVYTSAPLDAYSFDHYSGYSPPVKVHISNLKIKNSRPLLLRLRFENRKRNLQVQLNATLGLAARVAWTSSVGPDPVVPPGKWSIPPANAVAVVRGPLVFALHPKETQKIVQKYEATRPKAVDYEISTNETWNYALTDLTLSPPKFDPTPSAGWSKNLPFDTDNYACSVTVQARTLKDWGYWAGSKITASPPPSPVDCSSSAARNTNRCGEKKEIRLVPFGGTNIRVAVFPEISS